LFCEGLEKSGSHGTVLMARKAAEYTKASGPN
jgi:hypothetical protein